MAAPLKAGLPPGCELASGYQVQLLALDASGNQVAGVNLSDVAFLVTDLQPEQTNAAPGAPLPLLVPTDQLV